MDPIPGGPLRNPTPEERDLAEAAKAWGIETDYWDVWGKQHYASPTVERAILHSLGADGQSGQPAQLAIEKRLERDWLRPLPPSIVLLTDQLPHTVSISLSAWRAGLQAVAEIRFEQGDSRKIPVALADLPVAEQISLRGETLIRKKLPLPDDLPLGYHELTVHVPGLDPKPSRLIVCPGRAYQPAWLESGRAAGIAISLYGVRSHRNWGCGDTTDLKTVADWVAEEARASFIGLNPLHSIANRQPYNTSPYLPNSIFYRNPLYLDIEAMDDFPSSARAKLLIQSAAVRREIQALRSSQFVEYERVYGLKQRFLKILFRHFLKDWKAATPRAQEFAGYIQRENSLLHRFAVHAALDEAMHKEHPHIWHWRDWPAPFQNPDSVETREFAEKNWRDVLYHKYVQWQLDRQFAAAQEHARQRGLAIGLYHDLALATDRFGCDLWAHRGFFVNGCRVGAPPDIFSPKGQDWSFPPPSSESHFEDGYKLFAESIRKNCRHGGALRIDHVMRFFHLYWIPDGMDATSGTYVRDRAEDLLGILALESVRQKVLVVGEDLGTVPDEIRKMLRRFGVLSYGLLYFEQDKDGRFLPPQDYPREALVSATTHDLPTIGGFWQGRDIEARRNAGLLPDDATYHRMHEERTAEKQRILDLLHSLHLLPDWFSRNARDIPELTGEVHNAIVGLLASTPSKLMLLNQEDLLKETEQQNLPGSTEQYPNWRRKMKCTVEELWASPEVRAFTQMFRSWLERTGRLNSFDKR